MQSVAPLLFFSLMQMRDVGIEAQSCLQNMGFQQVVGLS